MPTPVSVTTPITMPTVAAAAPTASAYLAPVEKLSISAGMAMRPCTLKDFNNSGVPTIVASSRPTFRWVFSMPPDSSAASSACSASISPQRRAVLPWVRVVSPTMAQRLMPLKAASYGVRPLTRMKISRASGISVGQRSRSDWRRRGISSSVSPRRPCRLASKCTCMKTPRKCKKAGAVDAGEAEVEPPGAVVVAGDAKRNVQPHGVQARPEVAVRRPERGKRHRGRQGLGGGQRRALPSLSLCAPAT